MSLFNDLIPMSSPTILHIPEFIGIDALLVWFKLIGVGQLDSVVCLKEARISNKRQF